MEEIYPDKCNRCGAPIDWNEGASFTKCGFCGKKNFIKKDLFKSFIIFATIKNPKELIENPRKILIFLPFIFLILILVSNVKKESKMEIGWPDNWEKLKQQKYKGKNYPLNWPSNLKESHVVRFMPNMIENCKYRNSLKKERDNLNSVLDKSLYELNIRVGNTEQFFISIPGGGGNTLRSNYYKFSRNDNDKQQTINNFKRINEKLVRDGKTYSKFYSDAYNNWATKEVDELRNLIELQDNKIFASFVEGVRQSGDENWKLYTRWSKQGIWDLGWYYNDMYKKSRQHRKISFEDWLIKKRILDDSHFEERVKGNKSLKYNFPIVEFKIDQICKGTKLES